MSKANFNIAKAITLLSEVISEAAAIIPPRTLDAFGNEIDLKMKSLLLRVNMPNGAASQKIFLMMLLIH